MKKMKLLVITIMAIGLLAGCSKIIRMEDVIQAVSLEVEPSDWVSESAIATLSFSRVHLAMLLRSKRIIEPCIERNILVMKSKMLLIPFG